MKNITKNIKMKNYEINSDAFLEYVEFLYFFNHSKKVPKKEMIKIVKSEMPKEKDYKAHEKYYNSLSQDAKNYIEVYEWGSGLITQDIHSVSFESIIEYIKVSTFLKPEFVKKAVSMFKKLIKLYDSRDNGYKEQSKKLSHFLDGLLNYFDQGLNSLLSVLNKAPTLDCQWLYRGVHSQTMPAGEYKKYKLESYIGEKIAFNTISSFTIDPDVAYGYMKDDSCCLFKLEYSPKLKTLFTGAFSKTYHWQKEVIVEPFTAVVKDIYIFNTNKNVVTGNIGITVFYIKLVS